MVKLRLHQFLSKSGVFSTKKEVIEAIRSGKIKVANAVITDPDHRINQKKKNIYYEGQLIRTKRKRYFLFYKPKRYNCQKNQKKTIYNLIDQWNLDEATKKSLFTVGRLDVDSSGLIIVTNDGLLSNEILSPEKNIKKIYSVLIDKPINNRDLDKLRNGVVIDLEDKKYKTKPCIAEIKNPKELEITITEGKKRQIRRMFGALDYKIKELKRISIGSLKLNNLQPKEYKEITKEEIYEKIFR